MTEPLCPQELGRLIRAAYIRQRAPELIRQQRVRTYYRTRWWR